MPPEAQTLAALAAVAAAATWLAVRFFRKPNPACGHDCDCPANKLKAKLKHDTLSRQPPPFR
ncbi:MAG: hypothetical protein LBI02_10450 [Opitutaceae bacterium]|jgi:hypothetical protein|nr:hypothetical protein [Opitutaceae bacterium]